MQVQLSEQLKRERAAMEEELESRSRLLSMQVQAADPPLARIPHGATPTRNRALTLSLTPPNSDGCVTAVTDGRR